MGKFSCVTSFVFSSSKDFPEGGIEQEAMFYDALDGTVKTKEEEKEEVVRKFFPETWIWDLVTVG